MEDRVVVLGVGVRGPLAGYVSGFAGVLVDRGYAPGSVLQQLCPVSQLSRWLDAEGLGVDGLTELEAERFLAARRARGVRLVSLAAGAGAGPRLSAWAWCRACGRRCRSGGAGGGAFGALPALPVGRAGADGGEREAVLGVC